MKAKASTPKDMDHYIGGFPRDVRELLEKIRRTIRKAAPDAEETIKYQMPTFVLNGNLIAFAAFKGHIGLYPAPRGTASFRKELSPYRSAKSTVRFALDEPIPYALVGKIVKFRVKESRAKARAKARKR